MRQLLTVILVACASVSYQFNEQTLTSKMETINNTPMVIKPLQGRNTHSLNHRNYQYLDDLIIEPARPSNGFPTVNTSEVHVTWNANRFTAQSVRISISYLDNGIPQSIWDAQIIDPIVQGPYDAVAVYVSNDGELSVRLPDQHRFKRIMIQVISDDDSQYGYTMFDWFFD